MRVCGSAQLPTYMVVTRRLLSSSLRTSSMLGLCCSWQGLCSKIFSDRVGDGGPTAALARRAQRGRLVCGDADVGGVSNPMGKELLKHYTGLSRVRFQSPTL